MNSKSKKRVVVSVINDLSTDQRVHKSCLSIQNAGFEVLLIGRVLKNSLPVNRSYPTHRMKLMFDKGFLFYLEFNLRLFIKLIFTKSDILHSNDLDTLLPNFLISKLKSKHLVYDTHEFYTGVPELAQRPFKRKIWERLEAFVFPNLKHVFTVNNSIAQKYKQLYGKELKVIRNISSRNLIPVKTKTKRELNLPEDKFLIILQGSGINIDRGGEELVEAMRNLNDCFLVIVGSGDVIGILKEKVNNLNLKNVLFVSRLPYEEMMQYTLNSNLGVTLDKPNNENYWMSLPNKIFDYIHAGIPVLASTLPETSKIINQYNIGILIPEVNSNEIEKAVKSILNKPNNCEIWTQNLKQASNELTWENEVKPMVELYESFR